MATPIYPQDDFPDLTLPDRTEPPSQPLSLIPKAKNLPVRSADWREGDRVLAPWEPDALYAGVIQQIEDDQAHILFGDGDEGWVFLYQVRPLSLAPGQKVFCRRPDGLFSPAEILAVSGDRIQVLSADGGGDKWTSSAALRIPAQPNGPGAVPTRTVSHLAFLKNLRPGARVWAPWAATTLYCGTVRELNDREEAHIQFDDGDAGWVKLGQILPLSFFVGMRVMARWKMGSHWYAGTIADINKGRVFIQYDDGDKEWASSAALMLPSVPQGSDARPTRNANGGGRWLFWLIPVAIIILFRIFR